MSSRRISSNRNLLFLGTELGLWISLDGGRQWVQYKGGDLPSVPVRDLAIHPRDHDLVIATHGRGMWIIDDITPLRALTPETVATNVVLIQARPSVAAISGSGGWVNGDATFVGPNPSDEAVITYYQKKRHIFGDLKMEIFDKDGKLLDTVPTSKRRGLNRANLVHAAEASQGPRGSDRGLWSRHGPPFVAGQLHREADQGQAGLRHPTTCRARPAQSTRRKTVGHNSSSP